MRVARRGSRPRRRSACRSATSACPRAALAVIDAPEPLMSDRGGETSVHVVLPAYRAVATIPAVTAEMHAGAADRALLVDDASPDDTTARRARARPRRPAPPGQPRLRRQPEERLRARAARRRRRRRHGPRRRPVRPRARGRDGAPILDGDADMVIGSRLLDDQAIAGGMPRWKWVGNRLLTAMENRAFGVRFSEYHTGYRAFSADLLRSIPFLRNSDSFVFDQELFAQVVAHGARVVEIPIPTRYFHEASSVELHDERALRPRHARRCSPRFTARPPRPELDAPAPPRGRLAGATGPVGETGCVSRRRLPRLRPRRLGAAGGGAGAAPRLRRGDARLHHRPRRARLRLLRALARARRGLRPVLRARRRRSARPATPSCSPGSTTSPASPARASPSGCRRRGSSQAFVGTLARRADRRSSPRSSGGGGRRSRRSRWGRSTSPLILVGGALMSEPLFVVLMLGSLAAAIQHRRSPHAYRWALLAGFVAGLAVLTRANGARPAAPAGGRRSGPCAHAGRGARWRPLRCSSPSRSRPSRRGRSATPSSCTRSSR